MVQAGDEVADAETALRGGIQCETAATIHAALGQVIPVADGHCLIVEFKCSYGSRDMTHVVASHEIAIVADAISMRVAVG